MDGYTLFRSCLLLDCLLIAVSISLYFILEFQSIFSTFSDLKPSGTGSKGSKPTCNSVKMGFTNYFMLSKPAKKLTKTRKPQVIEEVCVSPPNSSRDSSVALSSQYIALSEAQLAGDIRHQVLLNYLYQRQRSLLWIHDTNGTTEGVMIRKERSNYMYSPLQLARSVFAQQIQVLNAQVSDFDFVESFPTAICINMPCRPP